MPKFFYTLKRGHQGADVVRLQNFLLAQGIELVFGVDGDFGADTARGVRKFQEDNNLAVDGLFGPDCVKAALPMGYENISFDEPIPRTSAEVTKARQRPFKPNNLPQPNANLTTQLFGGFDFQHTPTTDNKGRIQILGSFVQDNIVNVDVPQLAGMVDLQISSPRIMENGTVRCHRLAAPRILALFARWEQAGLTDRVLYYVGCFVPRLKRKATNPVKANLSNHSWGTAFDINSRENWLGRPDAIVGERGCLRELVGIANEEGFYWGGHFSNHDGMHFELARL